MSRQPVSRSAKSKASPVSLGGTRVSAVLEAARRSGLMADKSSRIGGRISPELLAQAKDRTGIVNDTDLIEYALANIALDDDFADVFCKTRGVVDPELDLGI